jgi:hypothetical protein
MAQYPSSPFAVPHFVISIPVLGLFLHDYFALLQVVQWQGTRPGLLCPAPASWWQVGLELWGVTQEAGRHFRLGQRYRFRTTTNYWNAFNGKLRVAAIWFIVESV